MQDALDKALTTEDFARVFARFSCKINFDTLPDKVVAAVQTNLFDTLACSIAGTTADGAVEMRDLVRNWGGKEEASVLWSGLRLPAHHAAWINGIMSHARDYDDTHDGAVLHAGVSVIPAALAAAEIAEEPVSGKDFIAGIACGLELMCRLGVATKIGIIESGFIYSALFGQFAATVAAARVLGMDEDETVNALGIAYSQAAGTHQVTRDGAMTKRMQPGFAAKNALISAAMTRAGIRGAQNIFEGADGLFRTYLKSNVDTSILRAGLGENFHLTDLSYKPYPCCRFNHTAIDAALQIRSQKGFNADDVRAIRVGTNNQAWEAVATPLDLRRRPKTVVHAQFSICYTIACALRQGSVSLEDFTDDALTRASVIGLSEKVDPFVDPEIERVWGRSISPADLIVETSDATFTIRVERPRGSKEFPMTSQDFDSKLIDCLTFGGFSKAAEKADFFRRTLRDMSLSPDIRASIPELCSLGAIDLNH